MIAIDSITLAVIAGGVIGILVGCVVTAAITLEHQFFMLHCIRLPYALHRRLRAEAHRDHTTVRALIVDRLQRSNGGGP